MTEPTAPAAFPPESIPTQTVPNQAVTPPAEARPTPTPQQTAQFKFLMEKESEIRAAEQRLKSSESKIRWAEDLEKLRSENPIAVLDKLGMSTEDLLKRVSEGQTTNPVNRLEREVSVLAQKLEAAQKREEEQRLTQYYQDMAGQVAGYVRDAKTEAGSDRYPHLKAAGAESLVFEKIKAHYRETGQVLSEDQAAGEVDKLYADIYERISRVKAPSSASPLPTQANPPATLTNQMQSQPTPKRDLSALSRDELLLEAARALKFEEV